MLMNSPTPVSCNDSIDNFDVLRAAYSAFNRRDVDAALALMTPDVEWPRAFKGGFVEGCEQVRTYWTAQWTEIDPHVEPLAFARTGTGQISVEVHQRVRNLEGTVIADEIVIHDFTMSNDRIRKMEVRPRQAAQD
jgi:ketosteroid isomerase-like protein